MKNKMIQNSIVQLCASIGILQYLEQMNKVQGAIIIIAAKDTTGHALDQRIMDKLKLAGLRTDLRGKHWQGYIAVIDSGKNIYEKLAELNQSAEYGTVLGKRVIEVKSSPLNDGNEALIYIDGINYAVNKRGLNIVVYDRYTKQVVDSVCFDTHSKGWEHTRKPVKLDGADQIAGEIENCKRMLLDLKRTINKVSNENAKKPEITAENKTFKEKLQIESILPAIRKDKKRVRIVFWGGPYLWNAMASVGTAFAQDDHYDVKVILHGKGWEEEKKARVIADGITPVFMDEYFAELDQPDILIIFPGSNMKPFVRPEFKKVLDFSKMVIAVPFTLIRTQPEKIESFMKRFTDNYAGEKTDYFVIDRVLHNEIEKSMNLDSGKAVLIGNPKFDELYNTVNGIKEVEFPDSWKKLEKKRVLLWTTDHVYTSPNVTFDLYVKTILEYFSHHQELGLIFRPHPIYIVELLGNGIWNERDMKVLHEFFDSSDNLIWDEEPEYALAYKRADAVLSDMNCGICVSSLVLDKPIGILHRFDENECIPAHPEIIEKHYNISGLEECTEFLDMFAQEQDPGNEMRKCAINEYIAHYDGKNGERIKQFIEQKYSEKYEEQQ